MMAALMLSDFTMASSSVVRMLGVEGHLGWQRDLEHEAKHITEEHLERRQSSTATIQATPSSDMNSTIAQACLNVLDDITSITNDAGLSACYNIMAMDRRDKTFTADLRLYLAAPAKGSFATVRPTNLMIGVTYPVSTVFTTANIKRSIKRQTASPLGNMTEIQQYTLMGSIDKNIDFNKLTEAQLMSLMVPAISVNAVSEDGRTPIMTALTTTDTAYFVVGDFRGSFSVDSANPLFQQAAIDASSVFILPGTTFGIFPTGMIITLSWLLIFVVAYGFGTWKRYQHREFYRRRMHMAKGMYDGRVARKV